MFKARGPQSIRSRLTGIIVGILAASTIAVSITTALTQSRMLHGLLKHKGDGMASYIAKLSQDPLITGDLIRLDYFVNEANKDDDVVYAVICDMNGNIRTSRFAGLNYRSEMLMPILAGLPRESELKDVIAAVREKGGKIGYLTEFTLIVRGKEPLMEISSPIVSGDKVIGTVNIGMSEHKVYRYVFETVFFLVVLNLFAAVALGGALFTALSRVVFQPVSELARATLLLAKGDLTARVTAPSSGEIRVLVDGFNTMAQALDKRTAELVETRDELVRSEKMAMLGLIAGNMGNELRNPLGVMNNAVFFLKSVTADSDETVREYLDTIKNEIDNSCEIIADLVDFACSKKPAVKRVGARELVERAIVCRTMPANVTARSDIPESLPPLMVDPAQIEQVLKNLVSNALQAMPGGGILSIRGELEGKTVRISVTDTGEGIPAENMDKILTPLFSTRARGIGLGLAVSKNLVELNGGRIEVESRVGEGATFTLTLPLGKGVSGEVLAK